MQHGIAAPMTAQKHTNANWPWRNQREHTPRDDEERLCRSAHSSTASRRFCCTRHPVLLPSYWRGWLRRTCAAGTGAMGRFAVGGPGVGTHDLHAVRGALHDRGRHRGGHGGQVRLHGRRHLRGGGRRGSAAHRHGCRSGRPNQGTDPPGPFKRPESPHGPSRRSSVCSGLKCLPMCRHTLDSWQQRARLQSGEPC